jgi:rod shape-determining protein MreC
LEVVAFILIGSTHEYQKSTIWSSLNSIVAESNNAKSSFTEYLSLRDNNTALAEENAMLKTQIMQLQNDREWMVERDSQYVYSHLDWQYIPAKIVDISTNKQHNYITINKGTRDGIEKDMGVICADGLVGIVSTVSEKYALVVPLIHTDISVSAKIKRSGQIGGTKWNGRNYQYINLTDIARHIPVKKGDTIETSGLTSVFPEGILIGIVNKTELKKTDDYHSTSIELSTDYRSLKYVQVLHNVNREYQDSIYYGMD